MYMIYIMVYVYITVLGIRSIYNQTPISIPPLSNSFLVGIVGGTVIHGSLFCSQLRADPLWSMLRFHEEPKDNGWLDK